MEPRSEAVAALVRIQRGIQSWAEEMREKGIHVGFGWVAPTCITCGEAWPCRSSSGE